MDILIGTHQLASISGSEVVAHEFASYFQSCGHRVDVFANTAHAPMTDLFKQIGIEIRTEPSAIDPFAYDLVYFQHQVAGLFDYRMREGSKPRTAFVFGRLGRRTYLESGGWSHDRILADHVFANSDLTAEHLSRVETRAPITTFYNAAPAGFFRDRPSAGDRLRSILVVSNHRDPALLGAVRILGRRYRVRHVGSPDWRRRLVTPEMIHGNDLVISIGKTVQYALAGRTPVFVYDHFGGPGYLDAERFPQAARFSFSGRCCERRLSADDLAREVVAGYDKGLAFARDCDAAHLQKFFLPAHLDRMLAVAPSCNAARLQALSADPMIVQERMLAEHVRTLQQHFERRRRPWIPAWVRKTAFALRRPR